MEVFEGLAQNIKVGCVGIRALSPAWWFVRAVQVAGFTALGYLAYIGVITLLLMLVV